MKSTGYEVVWCVGGVMYVWTYTLEGKDVDPLDLPGPVEKVCNFIDGLHEPIPVMVYRFKNDGTMPSYCSHCNAKAKQGLFGNSREWLAKRGFK